MHSTFRLANADMEVVIEPQSPAVRLLNPATGTEWILGPATVCACGSGAEQPRVGTTARRPRHYRPCRNIHEEGAALDMLVAFYHSVSHESMDAYWFQRACLPGAPKSDFLSIKAMAEDNEESYKTICSWGNAVKPTHPDAIAVITAEYEPDVELV